MADKQLNIPLINRDKAILLFQKRVLEQAKNLSMPLLERVNFISILSSNLDEFFEVRMANMQEQIHSGLEFVDGERAIVWQQQIQQMVYALKREQKRVFCEDIKPKLEAERIFILDSDEWSEAQLAYLYELFVTTMLPIFTPIALDIAHPFPHIANKTINYIIELDGIDAYGRMIEVAILSVPENFAHLIKLPSENSEAYTTIQSVITYFLGYIFPNLTIKGCYQFRVTRNSDLYIDKEEWTNLRQAVKGELQQRGFGHAVRLELEDDCPSYLRELLIQKFDISMTDIYQTDRLFDFTELRLLLDICEDNCVLRFPKLHRSTPKSWKKRQSAFELLTKKDLLLHHPYQRFTPVIDFLREAAEDPSVLAIRMTVYRTGDDSELMELLLKAARRGKEVNVVVELMARFDEETNLGWASKLEAEGVKIVYGVYGFKTHAKMLLVVREERDAIGERVLKRYAHIGTGNYHSGNARLYTDFSLLTADIEITKNISDVFMNLSSLAKAPVAQAIWQAPFDFIERLIAHIKREEENVKEGKEGRVIAKMNALLEPILIDALYKASQNGVKIDLIVRGACALKPGIKGLSENITVRSIVGRFLEHSRVYYFYNNGDEEVYLSSADWMNRNFFRRVEIAVPIKSAKLKQRVKLEALDYYLEDSTAWLLDGEKEDYCQGKTSNDFIAQNALINRHEKILNAQ